MSKEPLEMDHLMVPTKVLRMDSPSYGNDEDEEVGLGYQNTLVSFFKIFLNIFYLQLECKVFEVIFKILTSVIVVLEELI